MVGQAMSLANWISLLVLSVLWGGSFFFVAVAVDALPPLTIVTLRVGLAALALHLVVLVTGQRMPREPRIWLAFIGMGALNNMVPFTLIAWGQSHIASGLASILNAATPIFAVVVAHWLTRDERMSLSRVTGVVLGFVGVVVTIGPAVLTGLGVNVLAQLAILGAALSYAFAGVFGRRFGRWEVPSLIAATGQVSASALLLLPVGLWVDRPWALPVPGVAVWAAVIGLALLSTALAYILYFRILASAGTTNILLVTFLIPVSAIVLGTLFLDERLTLRHFMGIGVIGLGLAAIDGRLLRRLAAYRAARVRRSVA